MSIHTGESIGKYKFRDTGVEVECKVTKSSKINRCTIVRKSTKKGSPNYYYLDKKKDGDLKNKILADQKLKKACEKNTINNSTEKKNKHSFKKRMKNVSNVDKKLKITTTDTKPDNADNTSKKRETPSYARSPRRLPRRLSQKFQTVDEDSDSDIVSERDGENNMKHNSAKNRRQGKNTNYHRRQSPKSSTSKIVAVRNIDRETVSDSDETVSDSVSDSDSGSDSGSDSDETVTDSDSGSDSDEPVTIGR
jgi:hypothetical protein